MKLQIYQYSTASELDVEILILESELSDCFPHNHFIPYSTTHEVGFYVYFEDPDSIDWDLLEDVTDQYHLYIDVYDNNNNLI